MTTIESTETIGSIVASDYRYADAFKKMGIDFCYGGNKTIEQASADAGIDSSSLISALERGKQENVRRFYHYNRWDVGFLTDHILIKHHKYINENVPVIYEMIQEITYLHGGNHHEVIKLAAASFLFLRDLLTSTAEEENGVFKCIQGLIAIRKGQEVSAAIPVDSVNASIRQVELQLTKHPKDIQMFSRLTQGFSLPVYACERYKEMLKRIIRFENNLLLHIHLENNILFPKAIAAGKRLCSNQLHNYQN